MKSDIAIVGMACRYPDARSPVELWENVLAQRRAFRRIPPQRLRLEDYWSADHNAPDRIYATEAALIEGYEFDRVRFRVSGSTFRSADLVHWLALDIADQSLADAGFAGGEGLPRESTGVILGNTLTGEFSRADLMRLRWPYVRRVVEAALLDEDWSLQQRQDFLQSLEAQYKAPFATVGEETLAGSLSNTIAGRICNYFDLKGGGYTVDGACASSLLAVTTACSALSAGDIDVALAGGVDLSLDPFELVGFAKTWALAADEMRVYDARSAGFWPGEGCGFVVLMRHQDAVAQGRRIYAVIRGWGVSSDGSGGITRPEAEGQLLAVRRAYHRAEFGIETVTYFEGHGTGTSVGDAIELQMLSRARREVGTEVPAAVIGSIKANIGHTKAAAGVAGLIKTTMALHTQLLPPTTGCEQPHPEISGEAPALRVLSAGMPWPAELPLRAGVSAMGFGGINTHIALESVTAERRTELGPRDRILLSSAQDADLFLLSGQDAAGLGQQVKRLLKLAPNLSRAELADLAAGLEIVLEDSPMRAAMVASSPLELANRLETLEAWLAQGVELRLDTREGLFLGASRSEPRVGFLFPGQGSPAHLNGGALRRRFEFVQDLYAQVRLPARGDGVATQVAQPAIVTASLAALRVLDRLGIKASVAIGHSLGELTALYWAGAFDQAALLRIVTARAQAMADLGSPTGTMASIGAGYQEVEDLLDGELAVVACYNSPYQTVVSGDAHAVNTVVHRAQVKGLRAINLPVSHAFHSPLVAAAAEPLESCLANEVFRPLEHKIVSTITGGSLTQSDDLRALLCRQVTGPVRFTEALTRAAKGMDLLIEVGPGRVLSRLAGDTVDTTVIALNAGGPSLKGLLQAAGAAFALGMPLKHQALFADRFTRPFDLDWQPRFFANPCELAPVVETTQHQDVATSPPAAPPVSTPVSSETKTMDGDASQEDILALVRQLVAERTELPPATIGDSDHLLSDLHLNSITVSQIVAEIARRLNLPVPAALTDYANATVAEVAGTMEELLRTGGPAAAGAGEHFPLGVDAWVRAFTVELVERPLPRHQRPAEAGAWQVISPPNHPLADRIQQMLASTQGGGVMVCLPPEPDEGYIGLLLQGARAALAEDGPARFVLVQHGGGGAAFARTLHLERPRVTTCVVDVPQDHPRAAEWVIAEAKAETGYSEAHYNDLGQRREPALRLLPAATEPAELPLGPDDVLLATGGGKGITAECALALARETGARLALLGRSQPSEDPGLAANLERMAAAGVQFRYIAADVTDAEAVRAAVHEVETAFGPVTGILHGAARNEPQLIGTLDETACLRTLAPKVDGARNLLAAVNPDYLRLFVAFGSIIARIGLPGEADYALANAWLTRIIERFQVEHPACRCLSVEWSVWAGTGMGERLGRIDALVRQGITPIPPDEGISILRRLLSRPLPAVAVVVTGRFGEPPTLRLEQPDLPFLRFLERPRVYYPNVELVVDAEVSLTTDPYLNDHVFQGERLLPAVMGLEAMAQVAMALAQNTEPPAFEDVAFVRPVIVPESGTVTIRVAALVRGPGRVEVVLRSSETAFQVDHFRAICLVGGSRPRIGKRQVEFSAVEHDTTRVSIDPQRDLYGERFFQRGRFQRVQRYWRLRATECVADLAPDGTTEWFGRYLPADLVLGDPAARDAAIHAVQACIPHAILLPVGVDRLLVGLAPTSSPWTVYAHERSQDGDTFVYDIQVVGADGNVQESWESLRLRMVGGTTFEGDWIAPLLGPYIERRVRELIPGSRVTVAIERNDGAGRQARSDQAIQRAINKPVSVHRRPDGKPEIQGAEDVSTAHAGDLTLAVAGTGPLGCDIEPVVSRSVLVWQELLGLERMKLAEIIAQDVNEDIEIAATRVWAATECLKKAGAPVSAPLVFSESAKDGWIVLASGPLVVATGVMNIRGVENQFVLAVMARNGRAHM